jgi:hypothetical protein
MRSALLVGVGVTVTVVMAALAATAASADAVLPGMPAGKPAPPAEATLGCVSRDRLAVTAHPKLRVICDVVEANGFIVDPSSSAVVRKLAADLKRLHLARTIRVARSEGLVPARRDRAGESA